MAYKRGKSAKVKKVKKYKEAKEAKLPMPKFEKLISVSKSKRAKV